MKKIELKNKKSIVIISLILLSSIIIISLFFITPRGYSLNKAYPNIKFDNPTGIYYANDGYNDLYVTEKGGKIWKFEDNSNVNEKELFLDISDKVDDSKFESGLLGLAFHNNYSENGIFVVYYASKNPEGVIISKFNRDNMEEIVLIQIEGNFPLHFAGQILFDENNLLYIGIGDLGNSENGQDLTNLKGKVLRININFGNPYSIPSGNPFLVWVLLPTSFPTI
ncbi:MAG: PQQ-dependent sugar dehydrogenase [Candidatus Thorarchaeota archaeon]